MDAHLCRRWSWDGVSRGHRGEERIGPDFERRAGRYSSGDGCSRRLRVLTTPCGGASDRSCRHGSLPDVCPNGAGQRVGESEARRPQLASWQTIRVVGRDTFRLLCSRPVQAICRLGALVPRESTALPQASLFGNSAASRDGLEAGETGSLVSAQGGSMFRIQGKAAFGSRWTCVSA